MFDVGFSELLVIGVVALLVIGPEKLPSVARTVGALLGRMQRYVNDVKADINREIELDELKKLQTTVQDAARSIETSVTETVSSFQSQADELNKMASIDPPADPYADPSGLTAPSPAAAEPDLSPPVTAHAAPAAESVQASLPLGDAAPATSVPATPAPAAPASVGTASH